MFPAAIHKDVLMAVRVEGNASGELCVELNNTAPRFAPTSFTCRLDDPDSIRLVHEGPTRWANYFKVALIGLRDRIDKRAGAVIRVLVSGSVPPESSLSSSAAMTICSSLVIVQALGVRERVSRTELADIAIVSERLVGVNSGGCVAADRMDQAVSVFGVQDHAVSVSFVPQLATEPVRLPVAEEPHVLVISNTLVASDKKVNGPVQYNLRVAETRLAAAVLARMLNVDGKPPALREIYHNTLRAVADSHWDAHPTAAQDAGVADARIDALGRDGARLHAMALLAAQHIPPGGLTRTELEALTGLSGSAFDAEFLTFPVRAERFYIQDRALHVFQEALRVLEFKRTCQQPRGAGVYAELGALMNASHESLQTLYDCSCRELDDVVDIARRHGALGSRLTGAGWGGCCVHLVPQSKVAAMIKGLSDEYYSRRWPGLSEAELDDALFATRPARGACIVLR